MQLWGTKSHDESNKCEWGLKLHGPASLHSTIVNQHNCEPTIGSKNLAHPWVKSLFYTVYPDQFAVAQRVFWKSSLYILKWFLWWNNIEAYFSYRRSLLVDNTSCIQTEIWRRKSSNWRWSDFSQCFFWKIPSKYSSSMCKKDIAQNINLLHVEIYDKLGESAMLTSAQPQCLLDFSFSISFFTCLINCFYRF